MGDYRVFYTANDHVTAVGDDTLVLSVDPFSPEGGRLERVIDAIERRENDGETYATADEAVETGDDAGVRAPYADATKTLALTLAVTESIEAGEPDTL